MKTKNPTIELFTVIRDNGDGGFTAAAFTSEDDRLDYLSDGDEDVLTELKEHLENDTWDDYKFGYLGTDELEYTIVDGKLTFPNGISFHGGQ